MTTVLRPGAKADNRGNKPWLLPDAVANRRFGNTRAEKVAEIWSGEWFVTVPTVELYGTWKVRDLLPPEQLATLAKVK